MTSWEDVWESGDPPVNTLLFRSTCDDDFEDDSENVPNDPVKTMEDIRMELLHRTTSMIVVIMLCTTGIILYVDALRNELKRLKEDLRHRQ